MNLKAQIDGREHAVVLRFDGERVLAEIDDRSYDVEVRATNGGYLLIKDGTVFYCRLDGQPANGTSVDIVVGTTRYPVTLTDPKRMRSAGLAGAQAGGAARILAPMPGKVVRVLVTAGAHVEAGEGIVVVEAMKMQNEMKSPKAGTVASINADVGATVNGGDVLAVIE